MARPSVTALGTLVSLALAAVPPGATGQSQGEQQPDNCQTCHEVLDERLAAPARAFTEDIHAAKGFGCVACHGGDPREAGMQGMDRTKGFVGRPSAREIPVICGRCHSDAEFMRRYNPALRVDQVTEYRTSVHGQLLLGQGDTKVATCNSCHPAHSIRPSSDPLSSVHPLRVVETCGGCHADTTYMQPYDIPTDQRERYEQSIHWQMLSIEGDLSAPTCNDCHGNHGAAPPGLSWVGNVCGQCHSVMADNYGQSRHAETFALLGVPGCATCHQNHAIKQASDEMLGLDEGAVCARCHSAEDAGGQAAKAMRSLLDSLGRSFAEADSILRQAERAGMEVSEALFQLGSANNAAVLARASMHAFDVVAVREKVEDGLEITAEAHERGQESLDELQFRRAGLAISVTIIILLIVGLLLAIRQIEHRRRTT